LDAFEKEDKVAGKIKELVYNGYRAPLAKIVFGSEKHYVVATKGMAPGHVVYSGRQAPIAEGNCLPLKSIPIGSLVSSIESNPGDGGKYARGCGNCASVLSQNSEEQQTTVRLPSGERKVLNSSCRAIVGVVSRGEKRNEPIGKAGRAFHIYRYNKNWPRAHHKYRQRH
jgi:large subunit ribosomal protein L8e